MIAIILCSIFVGIALTLIAQVLFLYRWFFSLPVEGPPWKPQSEPYCLPKELLDAIRDPNLISKRESCIAVNLIFQMLFRELKDSKIVRRWVMRRMQLEFTELLYTTTGKLLDQITVRDYNLGDTLPVIRYVSVLDVNMKDDSLLEEVTLLVDLTYNGGFQLAIDLDMVFGKSAYLSVKVTKLSGLARLQFSRNPYTHWSFSFVDEPVMEFNVESHYEGRPMPQITSLIINQIRRSIRKKHTLPNYKLRYKPFFTKPEEQTPPQDIYLHGNKVSIGQLEVTVVDCNRLVEITEEGFIYVSLAVDSLPWTEIMSSRRKIWVTHELEIVKDKSHNIGLTFREDFILGRFEEMVVIESVTAKSPASKSDLKRNDLLLSIGGVKVINSKQAVKLMKQATDRFVVKIERSSSLKGGVPSSLLNSVSEVKVEEDVLSFKVEASDAPELKQTEVSDDYVNITVADHSEVSIPSLDATTQEESSSNASPVSSRRSFSILPSSSGLFHRKRSTSSRGSPEVKDKVTTDPKVTIEAQKVKAKLSINTDFSTRRKCKSESNLGSQTVENPAVDSISVAESTASSNVSEASEIPEAFELLKTQFVRAAQDPVFQEKFAFDIAERHAYLHVCIWCKIPEKLDKQQRVIKPERDILLGHTSLSLMEIALECLNTVQGEVQMTRKLTPGDVKASVSQSQGALHPGFDERLCYGDVTLDIHHIPNHLSKSDRRTIHRVKEENERITELEKIAEPEPSAVIKRRSLGKPGEEGKHDFVSAHFQVATYCNFCHKKIWLKTAFQCKVCSMVCHKKCTEKCQAQTTCAKDGFHFKEPRQSTPPALKKVIQNKDTSSTSSKESSGSPKTSFLSKLRKEGSKAVFPAKGVQAIPVTIAPSSSFVEGMDRKRHNSAPDVDQELSDGGAQGLDLLSEREDQHLVVNSLPRTRSSSTLEDLIKENAPPALAGDEYDQNDDSETTSSADSVDSEDDEELNLLKFYERQKASSSQNADELVVTAAKEMGRELYANMSPEERREKLDHMVSKLQQEIDQESENRTELARMERELGLPTQRAVARAKLEKSDEKIQSLALLMLHYCAGLQHCIEQQEIEIDKSMENECSENEMQGLVVVDKPAEGIV
ncbi:hypothetical protein CAPTEDRAFT_228988 [Capitella teleta]|uniref:PDZ domain-containing protein 8 n=1 Tax=Capitella teleta TaxID=283909 RepID=R7TL14_CAPTE|nr:hypothetical protein CAPTEDRAFT_228988 [Capitella teleta]|eukprot:ELT94329.1 hypothetical protein CAPTEDRAFT_228988 [Capitella teleta]